jgi:tetratricopeptide (TPR) repeat protein
MIKTEKCLDLDTLRGNVNMKKTALVLCALTLVCDIFGNSVAVFAQDRPGISPSVSKDSLAAIRNFFQKGFDEAKEGDALLKQGDIEGAIHKYQSSLRVTHSPQVRMKLAKAYSAKGDENAALAQYRLAVVDAPIPDTDVALNMALTLAKLRKYDEAFTMYRVGMRLPINPAKAVGALSGTPVTPGYATYQSKIAAQNDDDSSFFDLRFTALNFDANLFEAAIRTKLGRCRYGNPDAIEDFDKAIQLAPNFAPAYLYRAEAVQTAGRRDEAKVMYEKAAALSKGEIGNRARRSLMVNW